MFCILFGAANLVKSSEIICNFTSEVDFACSCKLYGCFAYDVDGSGKTFDIATGVHDSGKTIKDVKHLGIRHSKFNLMPKRLDTLFNLSSLLIQHSSMTILEKDDFIGLEFLEYLHLANNSLKYIPSNVFQRIPHLKWLTLRNNLIEELPKDLFQYNLKLEGLWMADNNIQFVNPTIFDHLTKLYYAEFTGPNHKCLTKYYSDYNQIETLKQDVIKCANPNEVSITSDEIFRVLDHCNVNTAAFITVIRSIETIYSEVSISNNVNTSPSSIFASIEVEKKCQKISSFFSHLLN